jgi:hypothetical protein
VTTWTYILQSVPWALGGLLVGWLLGRSTVAVESIAEAVHEEDAVPDRQVPKRRKWRPTANLTIGVVLLLLGGFTVTQGYIQNLATERQGHVTEQLARCTKAYSDGFADAIEARSKATTEAQDALDEFFESLAQATPSPEGREEMRKAFTEYRSKRAAAKRAQAENPYPDPPRDVCR